MQNSHQHNLDDLNAHLQGTETIDSPLSAAEYAEQVAGHLARNRRQPAQSMTRRAIS